MNLSLPTSLSETEREEQRKIQLFAPLSVSERGWGRGQITLVELTLDLGGVFASAKTLPPSP
jgi:hypothetical protein